MVDKGDEIRGEGSKHKEGIYEGDSIGSKGYKEERFCLFNIAIHKLS